MGLFSIFLVGARTGSALRLSFENINAPELGAYGVDHVAVASAARRSASTDPKDAQAAFATARGWMKLHRVLVVVEFILERVTNIAMGTDIDNIVEFEETLDLPVDDAPAVLDAAAQDTLVPV
jgi:tartronate-semialdehyde synthase